MATILVVDDEPALLELLVDILDGEGHEMLAARDGVVALGLLTGRRTDLIVTDAMMPRLDGMGLIRSMRHHPDLRDVPVIVLSAATHPTLDGLGAVTFLPKPFELTALLAAVATALRGESS